MENDVGNSTIYVYEYIYMSQNEYLVFAVSDDQSQSEETRNKVIGNDS